MILFLILPAAQVAFFLLTLFAEIGRSEQE